jgi:agmatine/peptidylarginine deiminase
MTIKDNKVPVSLRAFEGRMKRHMLSKENLEMKKCRFDSRWYADMGPYYFVEAGTNSCRDRGVSLDALINWAREDGILKPYEVVDIS